MRTYSSHRLPPPGQHDEGSVGNRAQGAQGDRLVEDGRAAELHDVRLFAGRRLQRGAQRLVFQLGDGRVRVDLERDLLPCGCYHHAHSIALANAGARGQATSTGDASGSVEKNRSSAWSKNSVEPRTRVTPLSSHALITTSSPPCPRRVTKVGPDFSRNAAEFGTRSAKKRWARASTSAGGSATVVVWIMTSEES